MTIKILTIPHEEQRYDTLGDWQFIGDELIIFISNTGDWKRDACTALHELVEALMCKSDGVSQEQVDAWDMKHPELPEPGNSITAPYFVQHIMAKTFEQLLTSALRVRE